MASKHAIVQEAIQAATPYLCFKNAAAAIEFYKNVFGATEVMRLVQPDGRIGHAEIRIKDSHIMLSDEFPDYGALSPETLGGSPVKMQIYVEDVDAVAKQAVAAGARTVRPIQDQFYGDRSGQFVDPFGYTWIISTRKETLSPGEMDRRFKSWLKEFEAEVAQKKEETPKGGSFLPEGFHALTPYLVVREAAACIEFLKRAFGAAERLRVPLPEAAGKIMHAEVQVGDSMVELGEANEQYLASPATIHLTVSDVDGVYEAALRAGATSMYEPTDQFFGEREAGVKDKSGNHWYIATPTWTTFSPEKFRTVQPYLHIRGADKMIDFLKAAFGAVAEGVHRPHGGAVAHATIRIGDSTLELDEAYRQFQPMPCHLHLYVPDTDATYERALRAGATSIEPPTDKPYGDRTAGVKDPFGNSWFIATHIKDVPM